MSKLWLWVLGALLLLASVFIGYKLYQQSWEEVSITVGLQKQARKDPVFVLNKLLEKHAHNIEFQDDLNSIVDPVTHELLVEPANRGLVVDEGLIDGDEAIQESLYRWVQSGGHLVYVISASRSNEKTNWLYDHFSPGLARAENPEKPTFDVSGFSDNVNATADMNSDVALELYIPYRFVLDECHDYSWEVLNEAYQTLACHLPVERGYVTVLTDANFLNGFALRVADNASLAVAMFSHAGVYTYYMADPSFSWVSQIFGQHWTQYALLAVLLALIFWNLFSRFGPSLVPMNGRYSHYGQHLENLGCFYRRNGYELQLKRVLLVELDAVMEKKVTGFSEISRDKKQAILLEETSATQVFVNQLLESESVSESALWLEQVQFVKELKV